MQVIYAWPSQKYKEVGLCLKKRNIRGQYRLLSGLPIGPHYDGRQFQDEGKSHVDIPHVEATISKKDKQGSNIDEVNK